MRTMFTPELVNPPFGDPGLFVDFNARRRALLFDLGDVAALAPRKILRVSDVFVSHTHMDHFVGFDLMLRLCVGRATSIRLFGPPGFAAQVEHKLAAYTWNLVEHYAAGFFVDAWEVDERWQAAGVRLSSRRRFRPEPLPPRHCADGVLVDEAGFRVRAAFLDHGIPCLGFALEEKVHVNVWKSRLAGLGLAVGPWLGDLKEAALRGAPDDTPVAAPLADAAGERVFTLGALKAGVLQFIPGEKICYVTDAAFTPRNVERICALAAGASQLYIETPFLEEDGQHAAGRMHLTARQAGEIARLAGARRVVPFHFSPRYDRREADLRRELEAAHRGPG